MKNRKDDVILKNGEWVNIQFDFKKDISYRIICKVKNHIPFIELCGAPIKVVKSIFEE